MSLLINREQKNERRETGAVMRELISIIRKHRLGEFEMDLSNKTLQFFIEKDFRKVYSLFARERTTNLPEREIYYKGWKIFYKVC